MFCDGNLKQDFGKPAARVTEPTAAKRALGSCRRIRRSPTLRRRIPGIDSALTTMALCCFGKRG